ncbi:hypothetical protein BGZ94_008514 [Podila epigama]|nr:hypothetical protein BGZ94_008514 [Podila epigama]
MQPVANNASSVRMIDPLALPEILFIVLHFTDRNSLKRCSQVSRLWRFCSRQVTWRVYETEVLSLFDAKSSLQQQHNMLNHIRFLEVSPSTIMPSHFHVPEIYNLTHLDFRIGDSKVFNKVFLDDSRNQFFRTFMEQNRNLCDLRFQLHLIDLFLRSVQNLPALKKLTITVGDHLRNMRTILDYFAGYHPAPEDQNMVDYATVGNVVPKLEELTIVMDRFRYNLSALKEEGLCEPVDTKLPVRALRLVNFDPRHPDPDADVEEEQPNLVEDPLIPFLQRFPDLEELAVEVEIGGNGSSTLPIDYEGPVSRLLVDCQDYKGSLPLSYTFGQELVKCCPKIKSLTLSEYTAIEQDQLLYLTTAYGPQFQTYIMWGIAHESSTLLDLLSRQYRHHSPLVELDISGCGSYLGQTAWVVFRTLPNLRHFRALGVPLDAQLLVGYDWVCTKLVTLAISVKVPMEPCSLENAVYERGYDVESAYDMLQELEISSAVPSDRACIDERWQDLMRENDAFSQDNEYEEDTTHKKRKKHKKDKKNKKRKNHEGDREHTKEKKHKKHRSGGKEEKEVRKNKSESSSSSEKIIEDFPPYNGSSYCSIGAEMHTQGMHASERLECSRANFNTELQILVCEQLGRLSQLRELTLEGDDIYDDSYMVKLEWTCLKLNLRSGLDRLAPLGNTLEKLSVHRLAEEVSFEREEMMWIAKNWCGYGEDTVKNGRPFAHLLGITAHYAGHDMHSGRNPTTEIQLNISTLRRMCPLLTITFKPRTIEDEAPFYYDGYEDY